MESPDFPLLMGALYTFAHLGQFTQLFSVKARHIIDVGASIGHYAILFSLVNPDAEIICLEPCLASFACLEKNIAPYPNIKAMHLAASSCEETLTLSVPSHEKKDMGFISHGLMSVYGETDTFREEAKAIPLDALVESTDLIKIDVEGHEFAVLEGATRLMRDARPLLCIEMRSINMLMANVSINDICALLQKYDYRLKGRARKDIVFCPEERMP